MYTILYFVCVLRHIIDAIILKKKFLNYNLELGYFYGNIKYILENCYIKKFLMELFFVTLCI